MWPVGSRRAAHVQGGARMAAGIPTHSPLNHTKAVLLLHAAPVCGVEGLLHAISVVDVNVDVQHTAGGQPKGGGR